MMEIILSAGLAKSQQKKLVTTQNSLQNHWVFLMALAVLRFGEEDLMELAGSVAK